MGIQSLSGAKVAVDLTERGALVEGDGIASLDPNAWYEVESVAASGSQLPVGRVTAFFKTPDAAATAITPIAGDNVYPITRTNICKTDAEVNVEEGTIDVTDDCENGYNAMILDGFASMSGTINGFAKFDDATGELQGVDQFFSRFFNITTDDAQGVYTYTPRDNTKVVIFIDMNRDVEVGDIQNTIIVPALLTTLNTGAALKDAQKRDISWTKAQGEVSLYQRTIAAGDVA